MIPMTALMSVLWCLLARRAAARRRSADRKPDVPMPIRRRQTVAPGKEPIEPHKYLLFDPKRGAKRVTQYGVNRHFEDDSGPLYAMAGVMWPARSYLNKLTLITGRPGSGKTVLLRMMMRSIAKLFPVLEALTAAGRYPGGGKMRWLVVDPTNAYLSYLYQCVPENVPIIRATPMDVGSKRWDIAQDITSDALNEALQDGLFPASIAKNAGDPFWYNKARELTKGIVTVYHDRNSDWQFHDLIIPIKYPQFLKPLLMQSVRTNGLAQTELVGRLGRDIIATTSSVLNRMAIAAALWQRSTETFSLRDFLDQRAVLHFGYTPDMIPALSGIANALVHVLVLKGISRNDQYDHTLLWLDEGRYLADVGGLEDIAARGRGAGFGVIYAAQGTPGLINKWGEGRVKELLDLVSTWIILSSGIDTADLFSRMVGPVEGIQGSYGWNYTTGTSTGTSYSSSNGQSNSTYSTTTTSSYSGSNTFQLITKPSILPSEITHLPLADDKGDRIRGFVFNCDVGAFEFVSPFLYHFQGLPDPPLTSMPLRPDHEQRLLPWKIEDLKRLKLEAAPELVAAIKNTWNEIERNKP